MSKYNCKECRHSLSKMCDGCSNVWDEEQSVCSCHQSPPCSYCENNNYEERRCNYCNKKISANDIIRVTIYRNHKYVEEIFCGKECASHAQMSAEG